VGRLLLHCIHDLPKEQMIVTFMAQLHPTGDLTLDRQVNALSYQAIID
jgi:hypothetical protein